MYKLKEDKQAYDKVYREANKDASKASRARYRIKHKEVLKERERVYYAAHAEAIRAKKQHYRTEHKEARRLYQNHRRLKDTGYKLCCLLRGRLWNALRGNYKTGSAIQALGCSIEFLKQYLEAQFHPGMTWENHGTWHIDHIKPLASFDLTKQ